MKKNYLKNFIVVALFLTAFIAKSQCTYTVPYGGATVTTSIPGTSVTVANCHYAGEYAPISFSVTGAFVFKSSIATDYITVTDNSNNVLVFGATPLSVTIPSVGVYRFHCSTSGAPTCGKQNVCRITDIIVPYPMCSGMPSAGIVPSSYSICPGSQTSIQATGASTLLAGIFYQWQQSPNGVTAWTNVTTGSGFTTTTLNTATLSTLTYYRMLVSCTLSAQTATTAVVSVNPNNPVALCYCDFNLGGGGCFGDELINVSILGTGFNNTSTCNTNTLNGTYTYFIPSASTTATLIAGSVYSISTLSNMSDVQSLWIDYNQSGTFDANEHTQISLATVGSVATIATFTVSPSAISGITGMRVRSRTTSAPNGPTDACTMFGSGEAEDYLITIIPAPICSGAPSAGTVPVSYSICPLSSTSIKAIGGTIASGLTYQWEESPNGVTGWTNVITGSGFNTTSLNTANLSVLTFYRMIVTCTASALSATTAVVSVNPNKPFNQCYCKTNLGGGNCLGDYIKNVSILGATLNSSSNCNTGPIGTYISLPPIGALTTTLTAGFGYSISVNTTSNDIESFWIDYNHSGTYDAIEHVQITTSSTPSVASIAPFLIPLSASTGTTGMRVRSSMAGSINTSTDACTNFTTGETEDYVITIIPALPCAGTPTAGTAVASVTNACSGYPISLLISGSTLATGLTYQWESSPNNVTWTAIPSATNLVAPSQTISIATYFRCVVGCSTNTNASTSVLVNIATPPIAGVISGPTSVNALTTNAYTVAPVTGNVQWYQSSSVTGPWSSINTATNAISNIYAVPAGTVYYSAVASIPGCINDTTNIPYLVVISPMAGDAVCTAISLPLGPTTTKYTVFGCTAQVGEPAPPPGNCNGNMTWCLNSIENSRWFTFVAPASGHVSIWAPNIDSQLALWKAPSCASILTPGGATLVAANDDDANYAVHGGTLYSSYIEAGCLTPGATYFLQLDTYTTAVQSDSTRLIVTDLVTPLNLGFTGVNSAYCKDSTLAVLLFPNIQGGVFTLNNDSIPIFYFTPWSLGTFTINHTFGACKSQSVIVVSSCVGISEINEKINQASIFPNPNSGILNISISDKTKNASVEIYDTMGKMVLSKKLMLSNNVVDISELSSGIYIYYIKENSETLKQGKLVKE